MAGTLPIFPDIDLNVNKEAEAIKNPAFRGAFMKGARACKECGLTAVNPYKAIYQYDGRGSTFAMAFRNYWNRGWNAYNKSIRKKPKLDYKWEVR